MRLQPVHTILLLLLLLWEETTIISFNMCRQVNITYSLFFKRQKKITPRFQKSCATLRVVTWQCLTPPHSWISLWLHICKRRCWAVWDVTNMELCVLVCSLFVGSSTHTHLCDWLWLQICRSAVDATRSQDVDLHRDRMWNFHSVWPHPNPKTACTVVTTGELAIYRNQNVLNEFLRDVVQCVETVLFCWICGQKILFLAFQLFVQWLHGFPTGDGRVAGGGWKATKEKMLRSLRRLTERTDKARDCYPSYSHLITLYVANWGVLCVTAGVLCALGRSGLNRHKRELALFFVPSIYRAYKSVFFFLREDLANAACMLNPPHPLFLAPSYPSPRWFLLARQRSYSSPCSRAKGHKVRLFACVGFFFSGTE